MDAIASQITVKLGQEPTVINVPPSQKSQYPAVAIMIDNADIDISNDDVDVEFDSTKSPGDEGYELTGFFRTDSDTNDYKTGQTYFLDQQTTISMIGVIHMKGRLWAGARLDPQREQLEQDIAMVFYDDRVAPGRLMVSVAGVEISGVKIPFGIATAMLEDKIQWNSEFAFAERLWTYLPLSIDVPLLVPRRDPLAKQLLLAVAIDLTDPTRLPDPTQFAVDSSGNTTPI
jgi:hypothetical protein